MRSQVNPCMFFIIKSSTRFHYKVARKSILPPIVTMGKLNVRVSRGIDLPPLFFFFFLSGNSLCFFFKEQWSPSEWSHLLPKFCPGTVSKREHGACTCVCASQVIIVPTESTRTWPISKTSICRDTLKMLEDIAKICKYCNNIELFIKSLETYDHGGGRK